jgi:hypothetical protein
MNAMVNVCNPNWIRLPTRMKRVFNPVKLETLLSFIRKSVFAAKKAHHVSIAKIN